MKPTKTFLYLSASLFVGSSVPSLASTAPDSLKKGVATAVVVASALQGSRQVDKTEITVTNRKGQTFTFDGKGHVSVKDVFGHDLGIHKTNNNHPLPHQSIDFIQQGGQSGVFVGLGLKGGTTLKAWINKIGLKESHYNALVDEAGVTSIEELKEFEDNDLEDLCEDCVIKHSFKKKFLKAVKQLHQDTGASNNNDNSKPDNNKSPIRDTYQDEPSMNKVESKTEPIDVVKDNENSKPNDFDSSADEITDIDTDTSDDDSASGNISYQHGKEQDYDKIFKEIDNNELTRLYKGLIKIYKHGVARPIQRKIPVYFVVGPTGAGKSTFVFACQGNEVKRKEQIGDSWRKRGTIVNNLELIKKVNVPTPDIAMSSDGVTKRSTIYYQGRKNRRLAFCDTEGFLSKRHVKSNAEKIIADICTSFTLRVNQIGGIVFLVSTSDIRSVRGENFRMCADFIRKYFVTALTNESIKEIKKSVVLLITRDDSERKSIADLLAAIIQRAYKDYYQERKEYEKLIEWEWFQKRKQDGKVKNLADLKSFFSLFIENEVLESQVNEIKNFNLGKNVNFFYPFDKNNVQQTLTCLSGLKPLPHTFLRPSDDGQALPKLAHIVMERARSITEKKVIPLLSDQLNKKVEDAFLQTNGVDVKLLEKLEKQKKELQDINENIMKNSSLLELVFEGQRRETWSWLGQYYLGLGLLPDKFKYTKNTPPIYRILISTKNMKIKWEGPKDTFIKETFTLEEYLGYDGYMKHEFISLVPDGTKHEEWIIDYSVPKPSLGYTSCDIKFYAQKKHLEEIKWRVQSNLFKITAINKSLEKLKEQKLKESNATYENTLKDAKEGVKGSLSIKDKQEDLIASHKLEMQVFYFWSTHFFQNKPSRQKLILDYTRSFEEATGVKIINDNKKPINNQDKKPAPSNVNELPNDIKELLSNVNKNVDNQKKKGLNNQGKKPAPSNISKALTNIDGLLGNINNNIMDDEKKEENGMEDVD